MKTYTSRSTVKELNEIRPRHARHVVISFEDHFQRCQTLIVMPVNNFQPGRRPQKLTATKPDFLKIGLQHPTPRLEEFMFIELATSAMQAKGIGEFARFKDPLERKRFFSNPVLVHIDAGLKAVVMLAALIVTDVPTPRCPVGLDL
ncbi:hypothetical protein [Rhizobium leguminosarum]|uniref:hypothetical protein n=1 Tax=Rhizobium TaxID=379 RepID=UPI001A8DF864|nr:hypothetical protein [Rhizobium leguminosarum]